MVRRSARFAGVAVSGILVWRRAPFVIVVVTAAAATALVRSRLWR